MKKKIFILIISGSALFGQIVPSGGSEIRADVSNSELVALDASQQTLPDFSFPQFSFPDVLPSEFSFPGVLPKDLSDPFLRSTPNYSCDFFDDGSSRIPRKTDSRSPAEALPDISSKVSSDVIVRGNRIDRSGITLNPYEHRYIGSMFGEWSSLTAEQSGSSPSRGFDASVFGGSLGWERQFGKNILWGFTFHGASIDIDPVDAGYKGMVSSFAGDLHLTVFGQQWFIDLLLGVGSNWNRNEIIDVKKSRFRTSQWNYNFDCGLRIRQGFTKIEPFLALHSTVLSEPEDSGFSDQNSLIKTNDSYTSCRFMIGGKFHWEHNFNLGTVMPHLYGFWTHEFCEETLFTTNDLNEFAFAWRFGSNRLPANRLSMGIGVTCALRDSFDIYFNYNNTFSSDYTDSLLFGGFNKKY